MISTSTSPGRGPSRSTSIISSGALGANATAARLFIGNLQPGWASNSVWPAASKRQDFRFLAEAQIADIRTQAPADAQLDRYQDHVVALKIGSGEPTDKIELSLDLRIALKQVKIGRAHV